MIKTPRKPIDNSRAMGRAFGQALIVLAAAATVMGLAAVPAGATPSAAARTAPPNQTPRLAAAVAFDSTGSGFAARSHHQCVGADFNGDGYADLAIGIPTEDLLGGGVAAAAAVGADQGAVEVLYGSRAGLSARGSQFWTQDSAGIADRAEPDDLFGIRLGTGDFNGDGFSDLAIGVSHESIGTAIWAGAVNVLYGSRAGLTARGNRLFTQDTPGVRGMAGSDDRLGYTLAAGDFNRDGFQDLAAGAPEDLVAGIPYAGAVNVLYGSARGLTVRGNQIFSQGTRGIRGTPEAYDEFGTSVAAGDLNRDGYADLAIGVPGEGTPAKGAAGAVHVLYGSRLGLSAQGSQYWTPASPGVAGRSQHDAMLGQRLAVGDLNGDRIADLVAGAPGETVRGQIAAGAVSVLYGSKHGLAARGSQFLTQDSPGILGMAQSVDQFGFGLSIGDLSGDGIGDLVVGPYDDSYAGVVQGGAVQILLGSRQGITPAGNQFWTQDSPGIKERSETGDIFGQSTTIGDFNGDRHNDLAAGASGESVGAVLDAGDVNVLYGSAHGISAARNQLWSQNNPGIADQAEEGDHFGELP